MHFQIAEAKKIADEAVRRQSEGAEADGAIATRDGTATPESQQAEQQAEQAKERQAEQAAQAAQSSNSIEADDSVLGIADEQERKPKSQLMRKAAKNLIAKQNGKSPGVGSVAAAATGKWGSMIDELRLLTAMGGGMAKNTKYKSKGGVVRRRGGGKATKYRSRGGRVK